MLKREGVKMDNVIITKIWSDADFFEVDIKFVSEYVVITQPYYLQEYQITNIVKELLALCNFSKSEIYIKLGEYDDKNRSSLFMHIITNKNGCVKFDITMSIIDDSEPVHKCSFFINSEIGLIYNFISKLETLCDIEVGEAINLSSDNN